MNHIFFHKKFTAVEAYVISLGIIILASFIPSFVHFIYPLQSSIRPLISCIHSFLFMSVNCISFNFIPFHVTFISSSFHFHFTISLSFRFSFFNFQSFHFYFTLIRTYFFLIHFSKP